MFDKEDKEDEPKDTDNYYMIKRESDKLSDKITYLENRNDRMTENLKISFDKIKQLNDEVNKKHKTIDNKINQLQYKVEKLEKRVDILENKVDNCVIMD